MATHSESQGEISEKLKENLSRMERLSQRMLAAFANKRSISPSLQGPSPSIYARAMASYWAEWIASPGHALAQQSAYWADTLRNFAAAQNAALRGESIDLAPDAPEDSRFQNPLWRNHPYFSFVRSQYLRNAEMVRQTIGDLPDIEAGERARLNYFAEQITDLMSPTNFLATNPDALERAVETEGESLVRGMENLVEDLERGQGELVVRLADETAFEVGKNLASTDGKVVYRNHLLELIQYSPLTENVAATPLIIFPPWINKFYILDMKEKNSLIRWISEQGITVFVVSWFNPQPEDAEVGLDDYIEQGYLEAIRVVREITGEKEVNAAGYCIAGTTLALTTALLKKRGEKPLRSVTFFTTVTDFSDRGEFDVFLQDDFLQGIEHEVERHGILDSFFMSRTFSFLRAKDLIYQPAIRSYMMGETPPAFDLLYWNGDSTNLPAKMAVQYLRGLCQNNAFAKGGIELCGETLRLRDVTLPLCAIACETDHIAAWKSSYEGIQQMGSRSKTFILSESGHIAGIVNPPSKRKYGHYLNDNLAQDAGSWLSDATKMEGSWWPLWMDWLKKRSGKQVSARTPGKHSEFPALCSAPGRYVMRDNLSEI